MAHNTALVKLFRKAGEQRGAIHHSQAVGVGLHPMEVQRVATAQKWARLLPGVYGDPQQGGLEQDLFAAWLWAGEGAVVSHRSAARVLGLDGVGDALPELTVPLSRGPRSRKVIVHRGDIGAEDRTEVGGLPVTSASRTLVDLAAVLEIDALAMAVESAWRKGAVTLKTLEQRAEELGGKGRAGVKALARVLRDCRSRKKPLESALEVRLWRLLKAERVPRPTPGLEFRDDWGQPGRIDFAYPEHRLAIEADGFATHAARDVFERDRDRLSRLAAAGWRVIHVTWKQLDEGPKRVLEFIAVALKGDRSPPEVWE
jgi:very-short-patch-repair endonuclease